MGEVHQQPQAVKVCKTWFKSQSTCNGKLIHSKSGQAPKEMTERQNWIQDKFNFLKMRIRCKGHMQIQPSSPQDKEPGHPLPQHMPSPEVQLTRIVWRSDTTIKSSVTNPSEISGCSLVDQQIMDQFAQMKTMLSFLGPRQETTRTAFCNYLASGVEALEDKDFQTFRNEAVKLLSSI